MPEEAVGSRSVDARPGSERAEEEGPTESESELVLSLPGGGTLRKRILREGTCEGSPLAGEGCIMTYREVTRASDGNTLGGRDDDACNIVEHERFRVLLASSSLSSASLPSNAAVDALDALTPEPPSPDRLGCPPSFAHLPLHLDILLRSMRPFECCGFILSVKDSSSEGTFTVAGEVELHCVLGSVCKLGLNSDLGGGKDVQAQSGMAGVTVRVISRSTAPDDRFPSMINVDSRVRLMVTEAPDWGCCGDEAAEELVEFDVGDGTVMEGLELAAVAGAGHGCGLRAGDVALITIKGAYTLPDIPAEVPEELKRGTEAAASRSSALGEDDDPLEREVLHLQVRVTSVAAARKGKVSMTSAERVAWGTELRRMGVALYGAGRLRRAEAKFAAGAELFTVMAAESEFDPSAAEENRAAAAAAVPLYNNLALCMSRRGAWHEAEEACTECLDLAPGDVKALLRRGAARRELGRWEEAEADFARALAVEPHSKSVVGPGRGLLPCFRVPSASD